jgi:hypothetical protein
VSRVIGQPSLITLPFEIYFYLIITTKILANTNRNIDEIFTLIDCSELYLQNNLLLHPSINIDKNILSVYTDAITVGKEEIKKTKKYDNMSFIQTEL